MHQLLLTVAVRLAVAEGGVVDALGAVLALGVAVGALVRLAEGGVLVALVLTAGEARQAEGLGKRAHLVRRAQGLQGR